MDHPISNRRVFLLSYILIWIILAVIQMSILVFFFSINLLPAFTDSFIFNAMHAIVGLAIWYPVRFNPLTAKNFIGPVLNIGATGVLTISLWVGFSFVILRSLLSKDVQYMNFLETSIPARIITDTLLFALLVLVYSLIVYSNNLKEKVDAELNLKNLVREAEFNALKTQINPHFLFNSLNSISLLIKKNPEKAREMVIKLSDFMRYSLRFGEDDTITLEEELDNMNRYLEIEKIRFGDKLNYLPEVDKKALKCTIPYMVLQPLIENAIKHGVYESTEPISIRLEIRLDNNQLEIDLSNQYDPGSIPGKGAGIGLKNIRERLMVLYGRLDLIQVTPGEDFFRVKLIIPQKNMLKL